MRPWPAGVDRSVLKNAPVIALLAANLVPVVGVLFLGWDLGLVMLLFWAENGVVGLYAIVKMGWAAKWGALILVPFFVVHFGGFMAAHLLFLLLFFVVEDAFHTSPSAVIEAVGLGTPFVWVALAALFVSHGVSFVQNFLLGDERRTPNPTRLMGAPYKRVVVLHVTIIFGGFLVLAFDEPVAALLLLVLLKTAVDVVSHVAEHRKAYRAENPT